MCRPELVCKEILKFDLIFKKLAGWSIMDPTTRPKFLIMNVQPVAEYCSTSNCLYCSSRLEAWTSFGQQIYNVPIPSSCQNHFWQGLSLYKFKASWKWICPSLMQCFEPSSFYQKTSFQKNHTTTVHKIIQFFCYINNYISQESWSDNFILGQLFAAHR